MAANRFNIKVSPSDKKVTIPIGQAFEEVGNEQLIRTWEEVELQDNINVIQDYETTRYAYKNIAAIAGLSGGSNSISYEFNFWDMATASYPTEPTFNLVGFNDKELAKPKKAFTRSFFKFDFYDSPLRKEQKIMFTNIMPLNNCLKKEVPVDQTLDPVEFWSQIAHNIPMPSYDIYIPRSVLTPLKGTNENYYIQWLKDRELTPIDTFYMSCQFYNAKTGKAMPMINEEPSLQQITNGEILNYPNWFYYKVELVIDTGNVANIIPKYRYVVTTFDENTVPLGPLNGSAAGTGFPGGLLGYVPNGQPIKFYEYVNP